MTVRQTRSALVALAVLLGGFVGGIGLTASARDRVMQHAVVAKTPHSPSHKSDTPQAAVVSSVDASVTSRAAAVLIAPQRMTTRALADVTARGPPVLS